MIKIKAMPFGFPKGMVISGAEYGYRYRKNERDSS